MTAVQPRPAATCSGPSCSPKVAGAPPEAGEPSVWTTPRRAGRLGREGGHDGLLEFLEKGYLAVEW